MFPSDIVRYIFDFLEFAEGVRLRRICKQTNSRFKTLNFSGGLSQIIHGKVSPIVLQDYEIGPATKKIVLSHLMFKMPTIRDFTGLKVLHIVAEHLLIMRLDELKSILRESKQLEDFWIITNSDKRGISRVIMSSLIQNCPLLKKIHIETYDPSNYTETQLEEYKRHFPLLVSFTGSMVDNRK